MISNKINPTSLVLFMFAVSFYPRVFAHVTKAVTGLDHEDPEFESNWSEFLRSCEEF